MSQSREKQRLKRTIETGEELAKSLAERIKKEKNWDERKRLKELLEGVINRLTECEGKLFDIEFAE